MAVASGLAGPVLAGPVFMVIFADKEIFALAAAPSNNSCLYRAMTVATGNNSFT